MKHKLVIYTAIGFAFIILGTAIAQEALQFTFMVVHVKNEGKTDNQKFFLGRLPAKGEVVQMVYVGDDEDGGMRLQLRVAP